MDLIFKRIHDYITCFWPIQPSNMCRQRSKLPVMAAEAALANGQSTTRLVLNADGERVDWGRGQIYTAKLAHLIFRRIFLAVFQIGACA